MSEMVTSPFGMRASNSSCTRGRPWVMSDAPATPPVWKVLSVSWVPGSPIDLGGDDADSFAYLSPAPPGQVAPITGRAQTVPERTGEGERT